MRWGYGEEECVLTRGGLTEKRNTFRNHMHEHVLSRQKSAEVVVLLRSKREGRTESAKEHHRSAYVQREEAETPNVDLLEWGTR